MNREFQKDRYYKIGCMSPASPRDTPVPQFTRDIRTLSGQLIVDDYGVKNVPDLLAANKLNPPLEAGKVYSVYEMDDQGQCKFFGEHTAGRPPQQTALGSLPGTPAANGTSAPKAEGAPDFSADQRDRRRITAPEYTDELHRQIARLEADVAHARTREAELSRQLEGMQAELVQMTERVRAAELEAIEARQELEQERMVSKLSKDIRASLISEFELDKDPEPGLGDQIGSALASALENPMAQMAVAKILDLAAGWAQKKFGGGVPNGEAPGPERSNAGESAAFFPPPPPGSVPAPVPSVPAINGKIQFAPVEDR